MKLAFMHLLWYLPSKLAQAAKRQIRIQEMLGSNLGRETDCPHSRFP